MTDHQESHFGTYFTVFLALCVFTLMSIGADYLQFSNHNVTRVLVLAIATAKALCVMMYFMHLKFERAWKYLLLAPTLILASAIPFALAPDVGMHYYTPDVPQVHEYETQQAEQSDHHGEGHAPEEHH
jgi:cytochrome c oxidase subunit 4